jgi:hypothetical protein
MTWIKSTRWRISLSGFVSIFVIGSWFHFSRWSQILVTESAQSYGQVSDALKRWLSDGAQPAPVQPQQTAQPAQAVQQTPTLVQPQQAAQIEWEYAGTVHRDHGLVSQIGPALGLTSAQIDALFVAASKL